jgi:tripartite-type tricarboxylate transporter receptor subunit TctC
MAGVNIVDVPYKTNPQATADVVGGQVDMMFGDMSTTVPLVKAGRLRPLAVSGKTRVAVLPEVPTMAEAGVAGYDLTWWIAAWAPAGTPRDVVAKLNNLLSQAVRTPKTQAYFQTIGLDAFVTTPDELMKFQVAEHDKWRKIITTAGIEPQ